jgi:hypothetical protein
MVWRYLAGDTSGAGGIKSNIDFVIFVDSTFRLLGAAEKRWTSVESDSTK